MDKCEPLGGGRHPAGHRRVPGGGRAARGGQGLTLVHVSAQRGRFVWDRGCIEGVSMVYFVSETGHVELKSGRV